MCVLAQGSKWVRGPSVCFGRGVQVGGASKCVWVQMCAGSKSVRVPSQCEANYISILSSKLQFLYYLLLCESAILVKGKSFVILYTYFSFKHLMENPLVKEFTLLLKG